jgi:sentrin-specific protease 1
LERAEREKDARINDRLRPKRIPLPSSLPAADEAQVAALMAKKGVIAKVARESVSNTDLARLRPGQWLNDEIINFYGAMIMERADGHTDKENRSAKGKGKLLDAYYFTSFFWAKLVKEGYEKGRLAKWTKKVFRIIIASNMSLTRNRLTSSAKTWS